MEKRFLSVLLFAVVISGGASYLLYRLISAQIAASGEKAASQLVVAAHELQTGVLIREEDVKLADWGGTIPEGAFTKISDVSGHGVLVPIYAGEPVQAKRIAKEGAGAGLAATIPQGMRAVAVRVNEVVGVAGFVTPGMNVDVLIAGNPPNASVAQTGTLSKTLLQNIQVLSAGQNIQKDAEGKPETVAVVNLLVTPEQAEALSLASNEARIQLVLRNPLDKEVKETPGSAVSQLFSGMKVGGTAPAPIAAKTVVARRAAPKPAPEPVPVAAPPPPPAPKPPLVVEVIHGTRRAESKFQQELEVAGSKQ